MERSTKISKLPPELLLLIAESVMEEASKSTYQIRLFKTVPTQALSALSQVNKCFRQTCIEAGLFRQLTPKSRNFREFKKFASSFMQNCIRSPLTSLGIDIGDRGAWNICADIMGLYPQLSELCLTGHVGKMHQKFLSSDLAGRIESFQGSTLIFRNLRITKTSADVLLKVSRQRSVTNFFFDRSHLHVTLESLSRVQWPLLPNLKKVKYTWTFTLNLMYNNVFNFCSLYLLGSRLTHFEAAYGLGPYCQLVPKHCTLDIAETNQAYHAYRYVRKEVLRYLSQGSQRTLVSYINDNCLSGVFVDIPTMPPEIDPLLPNVKLLVLRTDNLGSLMRLAICNRRLLLCPNFAGHLLPKHHHSLCYELSRQCKYFTKCELILIETSHAGRATVVRDAFWKVLFHYIRVSAEQSGGSSGAPRYLIAGNASDGYCGAERICFQPVDGRGPQLRLLNSNLCRELIKRRF